MNNLRRRHFLGLAGGSAAAVVLSPASLRAASSAEKVHAVAFDAFAIFDPRTVINEAEEMFPGRGAELNNVWRTRQFEYTWLRTVTGRYVDFWQVSEDALVFAARSLKLDLGQQGRDRLMNAYLNLKPWPDAPHALKTLRAAGIRLALLSNFTRRMMESNLKNGGLENAFEHLLSTDEVKQFKPAPRAYRMAVKAFGLRPEAIAFAAFAGWDAAGAKWFGFPTLWINRNNLPAEQLSAGPDATCSDLTGLVTFAIAHRELSEKAYH